MMDHIDRKIMAHLWARSANGRSGLSARALYDNAFRSISKESFAKFVVRLGRLCTSGMIIAYRDQKTETNRYEPAEREWGE